MQAPKLRESCVKETVQRSAEGSQAESKKTNLRRLLFQLEHSQFGVHVFIPLSLLGRQICAVPPERALGPP
jgi:hypothetical protein